MPIERTTWRRGLNPPLAGSGLAETAARSDHDHDGTYSPLGHNHDAAYAAIGHNHDAAYAAIGHNHDAAYSPLGHTHAISDVSGLQAALDAKALQSDLATTNTAIGNHATAVAAHGATGAVVGTTNAQLLTNKTLSSPVFSGTPTGLTKSHVGLANVDNTSDINKPISTLQQSGINLARGINIYGIEGGGAYVSSLTHGFIGSLTTKTLTLGAMHIVPVWIPLAISATALAIEITTAVAASNVRLGLYSPAFTLLKDSGNLASATTGLKSVSFTAVALTAGLHWLAILPSAAGIAVKAVQPLHGFISDGAGVFYACSYHNGLTFGALPASASRLGNDTSSPYVLLGLT